MPTHDEVDGNFILLPATNGGGVLVRRSEVVGGRPNSNEGCIVYLRSGPSVYVSATMPQVARYLSAEIAEIRRD